MKSMTQKTAVCRVLIEDPVMMKVIEQKHSQKAEVPQIDRQNKQEEGFLKH